MPLRLVQENYEHDDNISLVEVSNNEFTALVYANVDSSDGCLLQDQYLLMKDIDKKWEIMKMKSVQDCHQKEFIQMKKRFSPRMAKD